MVGITVLGRNVSVAARTDHRFMKFAAATGHEEAQATATGQEKKSAAEDQEAQATETIMTATGPAVMEVDSVQAKCIFHCLLWDVNAID